jgi:hypothetical protein
MSAEKFELEKVEPLNDRQLATVVEVGAGLTIDRREVFLKRIADQLKALGGSRPNDDDVAAIIRTALKGLGYNSTARMNRIG